MDTLYFILLHVFIAFITWKFQVSHYFSFSMLVDTFSMNSGAYRYSFYFDHAS